MPITITLYLLL